jgi:TIR domain
MQTINETFLAFLSYERGYDERDRGNLTRLTKLLQAEIWVQTGKPFRIFQDQENIECGQAWKERIRSVLDASSLLIAVITPSYLDSESCRFEFEYFLKQETQLKRKLILPILYIDTPKLNDIKDNVAIEISKRQWKDWRDLRFASLRSARINKNLELLAREIRDSIDDGSMKGISVKPVGEFPLPDSVTRETKGEESLATRDSEIMKVPSFPPPVYIPLPNEEDQTHPPKQITVNLRSTGDKEHDKRRIKTLDGTLISFHGYDHSSFHVFENGKGHIIDFPADTTRIDVELLSRLKKLMGEEGWQIGEFKLE